MKTKYSINRADVISTTRNWMIVNGVVLLSYFNQVRDMFVDWEFNFTDLRKMLFVSLFSLIAFFIKRFFLRRGCWQIIKSMI